MWLMQGTNNILILLRSTNSCIKCDPVCINYLNRLSVGFSHFCHFSHICLHLKANSDKYFLTWLVTRFPHDNKGIILKSIK